MSNILIILYLAHAFQLEVMLMCRKLENEIETLEAQGYNAPRTGSLTKLKAKIEGL